MSDDTKRIIDLDSTSVVGNDDGFIVDALTGGTRKILYPDVASAIGTTLNIADIRTKANGAMQKSVYDANNNGVVDNAEKVNNHTVQSDVPQNAVFTDTVYDDTEIRGEIDQKLDASDYVQFTGASGSTPGTSGIVPIPQQENLYLSSNGSWQMAEATPTQNSTVPVQSGGVYTALNGKKNVQTAKSDPTASGNSLSFIDTISQNANGEITATKKTVTTDASPTQGSANPVQSGGVYSAIDEVSTKLDSLTAEDIPADGLGSKSVTGNPISVNDGVATAAEALSVELAPIQDLHGYDKPWAGGAGKNLLPMTVDGIKAINIAGTWVGNIYTLNSVDFEIITDAYGNVTGIKTTGTASSTSIFWLGAVSAKTNTPYKLNSGVVTARGMFFRMSGPGKDVYTINEENYGTDTSFSLESDAELWGNIRIGSGLYSNYVFYPVCCLDTESTTFTPYSNICPISGHESCEVIRTGVNIWDEDVELGSLFYSTGLPYDSTTRIRSKHIDCQPSTSYCAYKGFAGELVVFEYDADFAMISRVVSTGGSASAGSYTFTTSAEARYLRFYFPPGYGITYNDDVSINYPSTETSYQPYTGDTVELTFGSTVYGGTVDYKTGKVTATYAIDEVNGNNQISTVTVGTDTTRFWIGGLTAHKGTTEDNAKSICDISGYMVSGYASDVPNFATAPDYVNSAWMRLPKSIVGTTVESIKAWITDHPFYICALMATPIEIQLTPQQLSMLSGINILTSDGDITLQYVGSVSSDVQAEIDELNVKVVTLRDDTDALQAVVPTKASSVNNVPSVNGNVSLVAENIPAEGIGDETASGNPIVINDAMRSVAKGLSVELGPVQDLHGYDNPWPAGGGKNLFDGPSTPFEQYGVTLTKNADESVTLSGTANAQPFLYTFPCDIPTNTTVTFSFNNTATNAEVGIRLLSTPDVGSDTSYGTAVFLDANNKTGSVSQLWAAKGINLFVKTNHGDVSSITLKIQCEISSTATAWSPYENICPIYPAGYDETDYPHGHAEVLRRGINQWDEEWELGAISTVDGSIIDSITMIRSKNKIPVLPNTKYCFRRTPSSSSLNQYYVLFYDENDNAIQYIRQNPSDAPVVNMSAMIDYSSNMRIFETPNNTSYIRFRMDSQTTYNNDISINYPATETAYHAYEGQSAIIPFSSDVYGGNVDFNTGVLTVTHALDEVNGNTSFSTVSVGTNTTRFWFDGLTTHSSATEDNRKAICDIAGYLIAGYNADVPNFAPATEYLNSAWMRLPKSLVGTTDESIKAWVTDHPFHICSIRATPITVQLTPAQITLLQGLNILTSDGNINLTYLGTIASNVQDEIDEFESATNNIRASIAPIEGSTAVMSHAVGSLIMFGDTLCKVTSAISVGETISIGSNVAVTTVAEQLQAILAQLSA